MKVRVHVYAGNYSSETYEYDNVDRWEINEQESLTLYSIRDEEGSFFKQVATFQRGTWNFVENLEFVSDEDE